MKTRSNAFGTQLTQEIIQFANSKNMKVRKKEGCLSQQPPKTLSISLNVCKIISRTLSAHHDLRAEKLSFFVLMTDKY